MSSNTNVPTEEFPDMSVRELLDTLDGREGHVRYTTSAGTTVWITPSNLSTAIKKGSSVEDKPAQNITFFPTQEKLPPEPQRVTKYGNAGVYEILPNDYLISPLGNNCAQQCLSYLYPDKDLATHFKKKNNKSLSGMAITRFCKKHDLSVSYYRYKPAGGTKHTSCDRYAKNEKGKDHYLALINPETGHTPKPTDLKHWILIKPLLLSELEDKSGMHIEKHIADKYMAYKSNDLISDPRLKHTAPLSYKVKPKFDVEPEAEPEVKPKFDAEPEVKPKFDAEDKVETKRKQKRKTIPSVITYSYDLETLNKELFQTYACGFQKLVMYQFEGEMEYEKTLAKVDQFPVQYTTDKHAVTDMLKKIDEDEGDPKRIEKCFLFAHNGARFDIYMVLRDERLFVDFTPHSMIKTPGGVIELKIKSLTYPQRTFVFRDTCKHISGALADIAVKFKFPITKGEMDHDSITVDNWEARRAEWEPYLERDVKLVTRLIVLINRMYQEVGIKPKRPRMTPVVRFLTAPSAAMAYAIQEGLEGEKQTHPGIRNFIRKAVVGGRVQCCIRKYKHPEWEQMLENLKANEETLAEYKELEEGPEPAWKTYRISDKNKDEGLISLDANSLYPSAMALDGAHVGGAVMFTGTTADLLATDDLVIATLDLIQPPPNILFPVLPTKASDGSLVWSNQNLVNETYTNIDLKEAHSLGYKLGKVIEGIRWTKKTDTLAACMEALYYERLKVKSTNKIKSDALKLISNSIYGKMVQKDIPEKVVFQKKLHNVQRVAKYIEMPHGWNLVTLKNHNERPMAVGGPSHIGAEILAKSKKIMNNAIKAFDGFFTPSIYYSDTDSVYVKKTVADSPAMQKFIGPDMGQFKNDYKSENGDDLVIVFGMFICSKVKLCITMNNKTGKLQIHTTFKGGRMIARDTSSLFNEINCIIAQYTEFSEGRYSHTMDMWKRDIEQGVRIVKTLKQYSAANNKRNPPTYIQTVKDVMPPYGYQATSHQPDIEAVAADETANPEIAAAREQIARWLAGDIDKLCITGGPGTGKTTLTRSLQHNPSVAILAPTNLAANMYAEGTTIHKFLIKNKMCYSWTDDFGSPLYSNSPIQHIQCVCQEHEPGICNPMTCEINVCKCSRVSDGVKPFRFKGLTPLTFEGVTKDLVLDEFSMVDKHLIKSAKRIIIVGDLNQLEPVNGTPMTTPDLLNDGWEVVELKHNYRAKNQHTRDVHTQALTDPLGALNKCATKSLQDCYNENIPILTWRNATAKNIRSTQYPRPVMLTRSSELGSAGTVLTQIAPQARTIDALGVITDEWPLEGKVGTTRFITNLTALLKRKKINRGQLKSYMENSTPMVDATSFTTHKAQGQTFDKVAVHLNDIIAYKNCPFYSPKLPYTAITRGRQVFKVTDC